MSKNLPILILVLVSFSAFSQESILKDFAEERRDLKLCLYPSTLRMVNIKKDPEFNEVVNDVEKLLIYRLDSATVAEKEYTNWIEDYRSLGYEEYVSMSGAMNLIVLGKDEQFIGVTGAKTQIMAFYLRGAIPFQKIPKLIQTFEGGDILRMIADQLDN